MTNDLHATRDLHATPDAELRHARIAGLGDHRPAGSLSNADIAARGLDTSDEWIRSRTGIVTRHVAAADETVVSMGIEAAAKAMASAGATGADVDLVILATCTMRNPIPGGAARIASGIGATGVGAFDLNAACGGFCYALSVARDAVRAGSARRVVVVGSEKLTDWLDWTDRGTCILFGDGAAAAVVEASDAPGIAPVAWGSDGDAYASVGVPEGDWAIRMDGPAVFRWATTQLAPVARRACALAGIGIDDLAAFVPHQANLRIIDALVRALKLPDHVVVARDIATTGNTSAASVPLALSSLVSSGAVESGGHVLLLAFGAGLTYAGQVIRIP
jgi:3-oxoacyl-[acyl-carrier-protein] synthase-3